VPSVRLPSGDSTHATHDAHAIAGLRNVGYKSLLRKYGISVISMHEQVDESPAGMLLEGMIEVIDEFYSTNLAQDTFRGMKENAGRGYHNGGVVPMGY
jgi:site-specific DNA recombinase